MRTGGCTPPGRKAGTVVAALAMVAAWAATPVMAPTSAEAAPARAGQSTAIDSTFGGGFVTQDLSPLDDDASATIVQPDGSTIVVGQTGADRFSYTSAKGDVFVCRYTPAGRLDAAFGAGGCTVIQAPATSDNGLAVALQDDGMIVVGGRYGGRAAVMRLTPSGALDHGFQGGIVVLDDVDGSAKTLRVQADGTILFAGNGANGLVLGHLNHDGSRDTGYGTNGVIALASAPVWAPRVFTLLADGGLLVGGALGSDAAVARYTSSGGLDPTFGQGGVVTTNFSTPVVSWDAEYSGLVVQPDGGIVAAGGVSRSLGPWSVPVPGGQPARPAIMHLGGREVALARYLPDGSLDPTFGGAGRVLTPLSGQSDPGYVPGIEDIVPEGEGAATTVAVDAHGHIVVGGWTRPPHQEPLLLRYTPAGLLDTTFGRGGVLNVGMGSRYGWATAMALGPDGAIAVVGSVRSGLNEVGITDAVLVGRVKAGSDAGAVWTWGWNAFGQLGDGTTVDRASPAPVPGLTGVVAVSAGTFHTLALGGDGTVWAWGYNAFGQLGDGTLTDRHKPVQVRGLSGVVAVAAGGMHSLALRNDGTVWAWGWNGYGQLGDRTVLPRGLPTQVSGLKSVAAISAGLHHNLALRDDGTMWAWGYNAFGQLGDGSTTNRPAPVQLPALYANYAWYGPSAGWLHSLGTNVGGEAQGWGWNGVGQVAGGGMGGTVLQPQMFATRTLREAGGGLHSLMLHADGTVVADGWNAFGQLGDGTLAARSWPQPVRSLSNVASVSAGGLHSLALTRDHRLFAWGGNRFGQLGSGSTNDNALPMEVGLPGVATVSAGGLHSAVTTG